MTTRSRILITSFLTVACAMAQQRTPGGRFGRGQGQVPTPTDPTAQSAPTPTPAPDNTLPLAEQISKDGWLEPKINGERLAELYTQVTGRRVTVSNAAITAEFRFVQAGPLSYGEAAELLKVAAITEGFVFVPSANLPNHDTLVVASQGLNPKQIGLPVFNNEADLPEGDQVVTYVMTLKYIKPDELVRTFTQVVGQFTTSGAIAAVPNASSVIICENTALIRTLIQLQKTIDVPSQTVATRFLRVQYADVSELAETLNTLLDTKSQSTKSTAATQRVGMNNPGTPNPGAAAVAGAEGGGAGEDVAIQIVPDPRTNRIFVMGRPIDITFAEGLIREFDTPSDQRNYLRRKLSFVTVSDFLNVAEQALNRAFSGTGGANGASGGAGSTGANFGGGGGNRAGGTNTSNRSTSSTGSSRTSGSSSSGFGSSSSGFGSSGSSGFGSSSTSGGSSGSSGGLQAQNVNTAPEARLVGRTLLVADNITNSIVIQGPPASLEIIEKLLDEIDVKPDQVMISCVFGQLTLSDGYSFGVDYSQVLNSGFAGTGGSGGQASFQTTAPYANGLSPVSGGLGLYGLIGKNINVYLQAKQNDDNFKVLSRPTIFTANNQMGQITSGTQIAIPTNSYTSTTSTSSSTNYEYKSVDLTLQVIPLVNSDKEITLQIYLTSNDIGNNRTVGTGDSAYQIPDILNRELITTVTVPNDQTIVLGGLITSSDKKSRTGIPILNRIPVIGGLFGTDTLTKDRSELLVFIQPKIVRDKGTLGGAQQDINNRYKVQNAGKDFINGATPPPAPGEPNAVLPPRSTSQRPKTVITK